LSLASTSAHPTIVPARDGWYWAIRDGLLQVDSNLELVCFEYAWVWIAGSEVEERPDRWRFYAGPIEPPKLGV
jgi:hypothetical protein